MHLLRKAGVFLAWILFLAGLAWCYLAVGGRFQGPAGGREPVKVHFLETNGDADCVLIRHGPYTIMIDTGEEQDHGAVLELLKAQGVDRLDVLILTHPDQDHIGGALLLAQIMPVDKVIEPRYDGENEQLAELHDYCKQAGIPMYSPARIWKLKMGSLRLMIYPPLEKHYKDTNNYSLAVLARHGEVNMLFTGDMLRKRSLELMETRLPKVALYKVPHHGRANRATKELFAQVEPMYAVVTSTTADEEVREACEQWETGLFFTGDGTKTFISDGQRLEPAAETENGVQ